VCPEKYGGSHVDEEPEAAVERCPVRAEDKRGREAPVSEAGEFAATMLAHQAAAGGEARYTPAGPPMWNVVAVCQRHA